MLSRLITVLILVPESAPRSPCCLGGLTGFQERITMIIPAFQCNAALICGARCVGGLRTGNMTFLCDFDCPCVINILTFKNKNAVQTKMI